MVLQPAFQDQASALPSPHKPPTPALRPIQAITIITRTREMESQLRSTALAPQAGATPALSAKAETAITCPGRRGAAQNCCSGANYSSESDVTGNETEGAQAFSN